MSFGLHTELQHPAQMHSNNPYDLSLPTAECCSVRQVENSLLVTAITPMSFVAHTVLQQPSTDAQQQS
jgi:hypothetical protein